MSEANKDLENKVALESAYPELMKAFANINSQEFGSDIISLNWIRNIDKKDDKLKIDLVLPTFALASEQSMAVDVKKIAAKVTGYNYASIELNVYADVKPATVKSIFHEGVANVKNVILVASGKGGVGKSTVAANMAITLSRLGCRVGLLDADVYGPSIPTMFGVEENVEIQGFSTEEKKDPFMIPVEKHGIKLMSVGFLVDTSSAMVWRGPMIASASMQMFFNVAWGELDYLIVDMPPGTGDIQLTISQRVGVAGSVIVSTPQEVALADVVRAKAMFDKVNIPVLGVVENMSYFQCDNCDKRHEIFNHGGARKKAHDLSLELLAEIPLEGKIRKGSDEGKPVSLVLDDTASGKAFKTLAHKVATAVAKSALLPPVHKPVAPTSNKPQSANKKGLPIL